jgi:hypothetical protein
VLEPVKEVTLAIDYWNIHLKDKISSLPEQSIYGNYENTRPCSCAIPMVRPTPSWT